MNTYKYLKIPNKNFKIYILCIIYILNIYNCNTINIQKVSHNRTSMVEIGMIEVFGTGGESYAKILREALGIGFLENGHKIGILQIPSTKPRGENEVILDVAQLFTWRSSHLIREGKLPPKEIETLGYRDGFDVFIQGSLYSQRDQISATGEVVLTLTVSSKTGIVLHTVSHTEKKPGISEMHSLGRRIAGKISSLLEEGEAP
jgi:hypothetical protein